MAEFRDLSLKDRAFLGTYRWRRIEPVPWTRLEKPLSECRLALVSTAGLVLPGHEAFDADARGGDVSFREIPSDTDVKELRDAHRSESYDHGGIVEDPNVAFPLDRCRELVRDGRVGSLASSHFSFMGSITAPGRLVRDSAPLVAERLISDGIDVALLIPI